MKHTKEPILCAALAVPPHGVNEPPLTEKHDHNPTKALSIPHS